MVEALDDAGTLEGCRIRCRNRGARVGHWKVPSGCERGAGDRGRLAE